MVTERVSIAKWNRWMLRESKPKCKGVDDEADEEVSCFPFKFDFLHHNLTSC